MKANWTEEDLQNHYAKLGIPMPSPATIAEPHDATAPLECEIEAECTKILEEDGWRALRTDPVSDRTRGKGFGEVGMADHLYIRYGPSPRDLQIGWTAKSWLPEDAEVVWIEFKRPGEKAKKHQTAWHIRERARGALTLIAGEDFPSTVRGFLDWYAGSGFMRNRRISELRP